jgi:protocatechuate 3,4-dioxygenase beta subunit
MGGARIVVTGSVLSTSCRPIPGALLDFWQADDRGAYDNAGFRLRGHQFADEQGRYRLETVVPGLYTGRTRHIHVRVQAPNQPVLTTQLYFPDEPGNRADFIFRPELVMAVRDEAGAKAGAFNFVLAV